MNQLESEISAITTTMTMIRKDKNDAMKQGDELRVEELTNILEEYDRELQKRLTEAGN